MASSIHARDYKGLSSDYPMSPDFHSWPDSIYGATKIYIEELGKYYAATHKLKVICLRFGGVSLDDQPRQEKGYDKIWLSRRDCAELVEACLEYKFSPGERWNVFHGISNNVTRVHCWRNHIGWIPLDDSSQAFAKS